MQKNCLLNDIIYSKNFLSLNYFNRTNIPEKKNSFCIKKLIVQFQLNDKNLLLIFIVFYNSIIYKVLVYDIKKTNFSSFDKLKKQDKIECLFIVYYFFLFLYKYLYLFFII